MTNRKGFLNKERRACQFLTGHDKVTAIPGYLKSICDPDIVKYLWSDKINVDKYSAWDKHNVNYDGLH